jgi:cytidylate kinase
LTLANKTPPSNVAVYQRTATTIRALAQRGRVIRVGRGSVMVTRDLPMATHVSLVAPLEYRLQMYSQKHDISRREARKRVQDLDHTRQMFYQQFWPNEHFGPESFHLTLNVAAVDSAMMAQAILPLIKGSRVHECATATS